MRHARLALLLGLAAALPAGPATAFSITGLVVAPTASNSANLTQTTGQNRIQVASSTQVVGASLGPVPHAVGSAVSFDTRYAALLAVDREQTAGVASQTSTSSYTITFTVNNPFGSQYRLDVSTSRIGALTLVSDGAGTASASLGAITGLVDGAPDPLLGLPAVAPLSGASGGDAAFSQSGSTFSLVDSAPSRTYTFAFGWTASATSGQDEAAVRLGLPGTLTASTADDYPGPGSRDPALDGHFAHVQATLLTSPEPGSALLLAIGLVVTGASRRRRA